MNTIKSENLAARCFFARINSHDKSGDQKQSDFVADFFLEQPTRLSIKSAPRVAKARREAIFVFLRLLGGE